MRSEPENQKKNDENVSPTVIYYSVSNLIRWVLSLLALEAMCVYGLLRIRPVPAGGVFAFFIGIGCFVGICQQLWLLLSNEPQLTISEFGIRIASTPLDAWSIIRNEEVRTVRMGRGSEPMLLYRADNQPRSVSIRKLSVNSTELTALLQRYRAHADTKNSTA